MDSGHAESVLEVVGTAHEDMQQAHVVDSSPYLVPSHHDPNWLLNRSGEHYHLAHGNRHEGSGECQLGLWKLEPCRRGNRDRLVNEDELHEWGGRRYLTVLVVPVQQPRSKKGPRQCHTGW